VKRHATATAAARPIVPVQVEGRMPGDRTVPDDIGASGTGDQTEATAFAALPLFVLPAAADAAAQDGRGNDGHPITLEGLPEDRRTVMASRVVVTSSCTSIGTPHVLARPPLAAG
jgi:hypothetical protein